MIFESFEIKYEAGDVILNTFDCVLKKSSNNKLRGELYIISENLCFLSKRFKIKIPINTLTSWTILNKETTSYVKIICGNEKHSFKFFQRPIHLGKKKKKN